jgi:hypothetical protein
MMDGEVERGRRDNMEDGDGASGSEGGGGVKADECDGDEIGAQGVNARQG